ncbi:MAG: pantetheine-phosphate adenylyltransferase [Nitrospirota bacterium]|nr:MAG: pantetheine-phosphate adenylyltransferase [Nitrospirota bacterium]
MVKTGICAGTFDPFTNGHLDIVQRSLRIFEKVVIAVAIRPKKEPLFDIEKRKELIRQSTSELDNVVVEAFDGLLVDYVRQKEGVAIVRGLRAVSDFEYEMQMAMMNRRLDNVIETVFMMPSDEFSFLTSTMVKEVASLGGSVCGLVPLPVERALKEVFSP